jgi:hypothetical protein
VIIYFLEKIKLPIKFTVALLLNNLNKNYENIVAIITQNIRLETNANITLDQIISQLLDENRRLNSIKKSSNNSYFNYSSKSNNNNNIKDQDGDTEMAMPTKKNKQTKKSKSINNTINSKKIKFVIIVK